MKNSTIIILSFLCVSISFCKQEEEEKEVLKPIPKITERKKQKENSYFYINSKEWLENNSSDTTKLDIVFAVNRVDKNTIFRLDSIIVPTDFSKDKKFYLHFPLKLDSLRKINKILFFSYATQTFAAYEQGVLIYSGPTNMGRKSNKTPTGLFFTNWKSKESTSTVNAAWKLKWNFNIENKLGVGFHEYALPGYPVSHSCLRLQEKDAKNLYNWANQWVLKNAYTIEANGTPVVVFGTYDFDAKKPWLNLIENPKTLDISENEILKIISPYWNKILDEQKKTILYNLNKNKL